MFSVASKLQVQVAVHPHTPVIYDKRKEYPKPRDRIFRDMWRAKEMDILKRKEKQKKKREQKLGILKLSSKPTDPLSSTRR
jgi:hypothetical protein